MSFIFKDTLFSDQCLLNSKCEEGIEVPNFGIKGPKSRELLNYCLTCRKGHCLTCVLLAEN